MSEVELKEVVVSVGTKTILKNLSVKFQKNSLTCVLGPNGAGKTTLIKAICRLIDFKGEILIDGQSTKSLSSKKLAQYISYVPQAIDVEIPYSLQEFLEFSHYPWLKEDKRFSKEEFEELILLTGLEDKLKQSMQTLSGGERQRAMIAAALIQDTPVILFDEITSALDPRYQEQILQIMLKIKGKGKTLIWSTHEVNSAIVYADEILALKDGGVYKVGKGEEFLAEGVFDLLYERKFERGFIEKSGKIILI